MSRRGYKGRYIRDHVSFKGDGDLHADDVVVGAIIWFMRRRGFYHFMSLKPDSVIQSLQFKRAPR